MEGNKTLRKFNNFGKNPCIWQFKTSDQLILKLKKNRTSTFHTNLNALIWQWWQFQKVLHQKKNLYCIFKIPFGFQETTWSFFNYRLRSSFPGCYQKHLITIGSIDRETIRTNILVVLQCGVLNSKPLLTIVLSVASQSLTVKYLLHWH